MKNLLILVALFFSMQLFSQEITGKQLLEKAIQYHDPNGNWESFKGTFIVTMKTPNKPGRVSEIAIDLPNQYFSVKATVGKNASKYIIDKNDVQIAFNGDSNPSEETLEKNGLSAARAKMYKNYYTYLYGLPMKLNDPGTIVHDQVKLVEFMGKERWVLKATYPNEIGKDTWYFYFNKKTYRMEVYQFFHDESKNDGEYILLEGEETVNGIKMPEKRAWYMNKDDKYLGTDILKTKN